jgi:predicted RND superfamily exporter protein
MCWTGRPVTPVVSVMPILILVVGITDAVHFLVRVHDLQPTRESLREVLRRVAREVGTPTTVTAFTAALGFLSFVAARIPNLRDFGVFAALGILGAWLTTFTLLPAAIALFGAGLRPSASPAFALGDRVLEGIRGFARRRARTVLGVAAAGLVVRHPRARP